MPTALHWTLVPNGIGPTPAIDYDAFDAPPLTAQGTPVETVKLFGGREGYLTALYQQAA